MNIIPATGNTSRIRQISRHLADCIAKPAFVFHEKVSHQIHVDIHHIEPSGRFPFHILATSGMSNLPMNVPKGAEAHKYLELFLALPPEWPLTNEAFKDEKNYWPLRLLKYLARYPHGAKTWISVGHTLKVTPGHPSKPLHESTKLNSVVIFPPVRLPESLYELKIDSNCTIHFLAVVPIFQEELDYAILNGSQNLFDKMKEKGISELLNVNRLSAIGPR